MFPAKWSTTSNGRLSIRECASMNFSGLRDGYDGKTVLPVRIFVCGLRGGAKRAGQVSSRYEEMFHRDMRYEQLS